MKYYRTKDILSLIEKMDDLQKQLQKKANYERLLLQKVNESIDNYCKNECLEKLKNIPITEMKGGIHRVSTNALYFGGFKTVYSIYVTSVERIAYTRGVSSTGAAYAKELSVDYYNKLLSTIKIRLNIDEKSNHATELVKSIDIYLLSNDHIKFCNKLYSENNRYIEDLKKDCVPLTTFFKRLFTSKAKKEKANIAYEKLFDLYYGDYSFQATTGIKIIDAISKTTNDTAWEDFSKENIKFYNLIEKLRPKLLGSDEEEENEDGIPKELIDEIKEVPLNLNGLNCELRRYQELGVKYILHQKNLLLGDEMGLGKTIQALAAIVNLRNEGGTHFLVVCPTSVLINWCREIDEKTNLKSYLIHNKKSIRLLEERKENGGVAVTNYENTSIFEFSNEEKYSMLIADEAHFIKNPRAKRTLNAKKLFKHFDKLLFMSGTPIENNVNEMISLIKNLDKKLGCELEAFSYMAKAAEFKNKIVLVYYRRKREDVLTELPNKTEINDWSSLNKYEKETYKISLHKDHFMNVRCISWNVEDPLKSTKLNRLKEIIDDSISEGRKVLIFSYFLKTLEFIARNLTTKWYGPINGSISPARRQEIVDEFNNSKSDSSLLCQIVTGGTGLNIQSASVVIICEPQLKPSIENQAISRCYRMGQARNVLIYRLLSKNTIDERIVKLLEHKTKIFNAFADESIAAKNEIEINNDTLKQIIIDEINNFNDESEITSP